MKKLFYSFVIPAVCSVMFVACGDKNDDPVIPDPDPTPEPVERVQSPNTWIFNDGDEVSVGSLLILESSDNVTAFFSAEEGLTTVLDFESKDDYTEITFPVTAIGSEIDLAALSNADGATYILSKLPEFGQSDGFVIDGNVKTVSEGTLSSVLEDEVMTIKCEFTTLTTDTKCSIYLSGAVQKIEQPVLPTGSLLEFSAPGSDLSSKTFGSAFYLKNTWDEGWTFSFSVSNTKTYINIGNNTYVEIYAGSKNLLNGEPFDVAETEYPFSFKIEYLDYNIGNLVTEMIDNNNREGASGTITLTPNGQGLYVAQFDLTLNSGDFIVSGYYAEDMKSRNMVYVSGEGDIAELRSATIDTSSNPCILYLSAKDGTAGPEQYDIMCEVPAAEWRFGKFMAFSGQDSKITWTDGVCYNKNNTQTTSIFGGNWRVLQPTPIADGGYVSECTTMLFGAKECFAYYYGVIKLIE